jgi:hypothetical protein
MAAQVIPTLGTNLKQVTQAFQSGTKGMLVRIQGYNGMPNDESVIVSIFETTGTPSPQWNGSDAWPVTKQCLSNQAPPISIYLDQYAYVANNVVVAKLDQLPIRMGLGSTGVAKLPVEQCQITAKLVMDTKAGFYKLVEGRLGGFLRPPNLFGVAASSNEKCLNAAQITALQTGACIYRDVITSTTPNDGGLPCDAFSIGIGFEAWQAQLGTPVDLPDVPETCPEVTCP